MLGGISTLMWSMVFFGLILWPAPQFQWGLEDVGLKQQLRVFAMKCFRTSRGGLRFGDPADSHRSLSPSLCLQSSPCYSTEVRNPKAVVEVESSYQVRGSASLSRVARPAEGSAMASAAQKKVSAWPSLSQSIFVICRPYTSKAEPTRFSAKRSHDFDDFRVK